MVRTSEIPQATRTAVMRRAGGCCEDCTRRLPLELHHLRYDDVDQYGPYSVRGRETPDDLAVLCRECHRRRHIDQAGDWWNDPQEMASYWESYYSAMEKD